MKVEIDRHKMLSNFEVYQHLVEIQKTNGWNFTVNGDEKQKKRKKRKIDSLIDLEIITKDLSKYLVQNNQNNDVPVQHVVDLMMALNKYKLEKIEKLQILNTLPRTMVVLYALIEDCDQRFTEDECAELLELVEKSFPVEDTANAEPDAMSVDEPESGEEVQEVADVAEEAAEMEDTEQFEDVNGELEHEVPVAKNHDDTEKEIDE